MKFTADTRELHEAAQAVSRATGKTGVLEGILIEADKTLQLTAYDLETGIKTLIDARIEKRGAAIIPARTLCDILSKLPDSTVRIEVDEKNVATVKSGSARYKIMAMHAQEFPTLPTVEDAETIKVDAPTLKSMVRQTIFAVATNDVKVVHTGVKFEVSDGYIQLVAVDGFRLAIRREAIDHYCEPNFIVPAKALSEVVKLMTGDVVVAVTKKHVSFTARSYMVFSRLLEGDFLNYKGAMPTHMTAEVTVKTGELLNAVERVAVVINDKIKSPLRCDFTDGSVTVSTQTSLGSASDVVNVSGNAKMAIGFNKAYLSDALRYCDTGEVRIELNSETSPILIKPTRGDSFTFLILPVRMKA